MERSLFIEVSDYLMYTSSDPLKFCHFLASSITEYLHEDIKTDADEIFHHNIFRNFNGRKTKEKMQCFKNFRHLDRIDRLKFWLYCKRRWESKIQENKGGTLGNRNFTFNTPHIFDSHRRLQ